MDLDVFEPRFEAGYGAFDILPQCLPEPRTPGALRGELKFEYKGLSVCLKNRY